MRSDGSALLRRGLLLEYATLGWNVVGVAVLATTAWRARSLALAGFGLDSLIEILASAGVIWQLAGADKGRERTALRIIAVAFVALAVYITAQAAYVFWSGAHPSPSILGVAWLAVTVAAMLGLAAGKRSTGKQLGNQVLISEAGVTMVDAYLAAAVLVGVGLNTLLGLWWADPVSSLVIVFYGLREAREAWGHARLQKI
jgi:divalent metal cation (Fe/Co/Zn/Cd) transporter